MKTRMKEMVKKIAVTAIAVAVVFGGIQTASVKAEAKGTAFINKKTSKVTPTVKSAKWSPCKVNVTVSVPANKVKKLGKVKKITVAYGTTKNSKKFEAVKAQAKVTKKGKNQYTFTINNMKLRFRKNAYLTVRFDGKTNWSKLVKVKGNVNYTPITYYVRCCCGKTWSGHNGYDELLALFDAHCKEEEAKEPSSTSGKISLEDISNQQFHGSYENWTVGGSASN